MRAEHNGESQYLQRSRGDLISSYVEYADVFEAPPEAHEAVAITAISAAANGNVYIKNGGQVLTLDNWTLLLSGSGFGRNTLLSLLWPVLKQAGLEDLVRNLTWGSKQGFYQDIAENPTGFFVWEEVSAALKALSDSKFGEAKQWLTNCYDNIRPPQDIKYRRADKGGDTPPITFGQAPRLSILATSSRDWFINGLTQEDTTGGFIPRWFLVDLPNVNRTIPIPDEPNGQAVPNLGECLAEVRKLKGTVDLNSVSDMYRDWYEVTRKRFREQANQTISEAFWNRHRVHLLKLATIFGMSQGDGLTVSPQAMERAIKSARMTEHTIFDLIPTGLSSEGAAVDKLEKEIWRAGVAGLPKSQFTRAFQDMPHRERESRLGTLCAAQIVYRFFQPTAGRKAEILVHKDYLHEHQEISQ